MALPPFTDTFRITTPVPAAYADGTVRAEPERARTPVRTAPTGAARMAPHGSSRPPTAKPPVADTAGGVRIRPPSGPPPRGPGLPGTGAEQHAVHGSGPYFPGSPRIRIRRPTLLRTGHRGEKQGPPTPDRHGGGVPKRRSPPGAEFVYAEVPEFPAGAGLPRPHHKGDGFPVPHGIAAEREFRDAYTGSTRNGVTDTSPPSTGPGTRATARGSHCPESLEVRWGSNAAPGRHSPTSPCGVSGPGASAPRPSRSGTPRSDGVRRTSGSGARRRWNSR